MSESIFNRERPTDPQERIQEAVAEVAKEATRNLESLEKLLSATNLNDEQFSAVAGAVCDMKAAKAIATGELPPEGDRTRLNENYVVGLRSRLGFRMGTEFRGPKKEGE